MLTMAPGQIHQLLRRSLSYLGPIMLRLSVVEPYPSEKWWSESQLGLWNSQLNGKKTCSKPPTSNLSLLLLSILPSQRMDNYLFLQIIIVVMTRDSKLLLQKAFSNIWCVCHGFIFETSFPECVARVPVSLWGSGGWGCVRSTLRSRAQPSATVRNRPQPSVRTPYGRAYGKFCRGGPFWRLQTRRCFVSRGRRGTSWHSDVFCNVSKVVLRGRRNTFVTFSEDVLQFSWQAQHFGRVHRHFSWQAQHFRRVALRVFCKSHWQGCVKWRQGANSVAGVAFCAMCWKLTEASHETSILRLQIFRF